MNERRRTLLFSGKFVDYPTENGVWIETIGHKYCLPDDWDSLNTANSIAVVTDAHKFRIALQDASSRMKMSNHFMDPWDTYLSGTTNSGITNETVALTDYSGATNTQLIVTKCQSSTEYAAGWCNAYTFPDGSKGYLPSLGELNLALQNNAAVDAALTKCGGTALGYNWYWSSTFGGVRGGVNRNTCWELYWDDYNGVRQDYLHYDYPVRAFGALEDPN